MLEAELTKTSKLLEAANARVEEMQQAGDGRKGRAGRGGREGEGEEGRKGLKLGSSGCFLLGGGWVVLRLFFGWGDVVFGGCLFVFVGAKGWVGFPAKRGPGSPMAMGQKPG